MRAMRLFVLVSTVLLLASPVWSQSKCADHKYAPYDAVYYAPGALYPGRSSEAWCTGVGPGQPGNMENAMSWDGTTLGTQWKVWGMAINANGPTVLSQVPNPGGGYITTYQTLYDHGQFWLDGTFFGPPGPGDYTGTLTFFQAISTVTTDAGGNIVGVSSNINLTGVFDDCDHCSIEYAITSALLVWMPGWGAPPANYPPFLCGATMGEYFDVCCIQLSVYCDITENESKSWGAIKQLYR